MDAFFQFFEKLVTQFTWRCLGLVMSLLLVVFVGFVIYESYTGAFRLGRMERTVRILEALAELEDNAAVRQDPALLEVHKRLCTQLVVLTGGSPSGLALPPPLLKTLAAILPWLVLIIPFLCQRVRGDESAGKALLGVLAIGALFTIVGGFLPLSDRTWLNYWVYPWVSFFSALVLILVFSAISNWRKGRKTKG